MLSIIVKPNSKSTQLLKDAQGNWMIRIKSPPVEGKANKEVIAVMARLLKSPKGAIEIKSGHKHAHKRLKIEGLAEAEIIRLLELHLAAGG